MRPGIMDLGGIALMGCSLVSTGTRDSYIGTLPWSSHATAALCEMLGQMRCHMNARPWSGVCAVSSCQFMYSSMDCLIACDF